VQKQPILPIHQINRGNRRIRAVFSGIVRQNIG
jgi:hypothetical protein